MIIAWLLFTLLMVLMAALFLGGICFTAGISEREIDRLQKERGRTMNLVRPPSSHRTSRKGSTVDIKATEGLTPSGELWAGRFQRSVLLPDAQTAVPHIMAAGGEI